jgi:predicted NUDIX family phosphoesterase
MPKALCIKKKDYEQSTIYFVNQMNLLSHDELLNIDGYGMFSPEFIEEPLFSLKADLVDRDICEQDESLLQVIPYISLFDVNTDRVFIYQRGQQSGEERLKGKCSVGLGGHVERQPGNGVSFAKIVAEEAARELYEEVGISTTNELLVDLESRMLNNKYLPLYSEQSPVSRVHLGVGVVLHTNPGDIGEREHEIISSPNWMHPIDIIAQHEHGRIELEDWSIQMVHHIYESFIVPALPRHPFTLQEARRNIILSR